MAKRSNKASETIVIPLRLINGQPRFLHGGPLPNLRDGIAEMRLPAYMVTDRALLEKLREERKVSFLKKGAQVLLGMRRERVTPLQASVIPTPEKVEQGSDFVYVPALLKEASQLLLRGTKEAELLPVHCQVTGVTQEASSLNHAYTLASQVYEHGRRSNTGNIFDLGFFYDDDHVWRPLRVLRDRFEAEFETRFRA